MQIRTLLLVLVTWTAALAQNAHPRLTLSPTMLAELRVKACIGQPAGCVVDRDYTTIKNDADTLKHYAVQGLTVSTMSNSNPITVTVNEDIGVNGWCGANGAQVSMYMGGLPPGPWSALNVTTRVSLGNATRTGPNTFTFPMDSTTWGPYPGGAVLFTANSTCNKMLYYDYEGLGWSSWLTELGLMYQITGDTSYATPALALLDYINTLTPAGIIAPFAIDSGFPARGAVLGVAKAYDWFYPLLSPAQKTATVATLNFWYNYYSTNINNPNLIFIGKGLATSNYWGGFMLGFGAAGLATLGDNSNAPAINTFIRSQMDTYMAQAMAPPQPGWYSDASDQCPFQGGSAQCGGTYAGGGQAEGYNYGPNHIQRVLEYIHDVLTATNEDMYSTTTYASAMTLAFATNMTYSLFPNLWQAPNTGESADVLPMYLNLPSMIAYLRQGHTESGWMQWMINHAATPPSGLFQYVGFQGATTSSLPMDRFIWGRPDIPAVDYTAAEPPYAFSNGDGEIHWRSDWTPSATKLTFSASPVYPVGHHIRNAGGVTLTRGSDYLIINAGHYAGANGYSGPSANTIISDTSPVLHFEDGKAYMYGYQTQQVWGQWITPLYKLDPVYGYAQNDFTGAYDDKPGSGKDADKRTLRYYFRSVAQIGSSTFVYDRVMGKNGAYDKKVYWPISPITTAMPTLSGNIASAVVGGSKVWIQPLSPASPSTALVKVDRGNPYVMQIGDPSGGPAAEFLTLIYSADSSGTLPSANLLESSGNVVAAQVAEATPKVFVHAKVVKDNGNNTYTATPQTSVTFTSTHAGIGRYVVAGLAPNTYAISCGGVSVGTQVVGTDGSLTFTSPSGSFSVAPFYAITSQPSTLTAGVANYPYPGATFTAKGGSAPYSYSATGLPPGLTVNPNSGVLSGTPTQAGSYNITVTATDSGGQKTSAGFGLEVAANWPSLTITSGLPPNLYVGSAFSFPLTATGGNGSYTWTLAAGTLPAGLTLSTGGMIAGVPSATGVKAVSVQVKSGDGQVVVLPLSFVVSTAPPSISLSGISASGMVVR